MITGNIHLDMLENLTFAKLEENSVGGEPPHYTDVVDVLWEVLWVLDREGRHNHMVSKFLRLDAP
jgi:hypothetical protein